MRRGKLDVRRIQSEVSAAQGTFARVELYPTVDGKLYAKAVLQTVNYNTYVISIRFTDSYPNEMPKVLIEAPTITTAPHRYQGGAICYLHPSMWNPGIHNVTFVIARAAKWLNKFEVWKVKGRWPGAEIKH